MAWRHFIMHFIRHVDGRVCVRAAIRRPQPALQRTQRASEGDQRGEHRHKEEANDQVAWSASEIERQQD